MAGSSSASSSTRRRDWRFHSRKDQSEPVHLSIPSPDPSLSQFQLGPLTVHTYALCILTGIIAAVLIAQRRLGFERYQYFFWRAQREQR